MKNLFLFIRRAGFKILLICFVFINILLITSKNSSASPPQDPQQCKWSGQDCPDGQTYREVCLVDGDGNTCSCGSVTRSCP